MKRITDKNFKYVPAAKTDIAKTFRRLRAEAKAKQDQVVTPFLKAKRA